MLVLSLLVLASSLFSVTVAQTAAPDGAIVPFSQLPACASLCGPLFDVQGACTTGSAQSCFCSDARLKPFLQSTSGVQSVCGAASCKDSASLQQIQTWYEGFCKDASTTVPDGSDTTSPPSSTTSSPATGNKNKPANKTWIESHYGWVIFAVVVAVAMIGGWVGASYFRRRYLRKKEREIEMRPPVSWGPHQMQAMTGGFNASEVALSPDAGRVVPSPGPEGTAGNRESRGWLRKERR